MKHAKLERRLPHHRNATDTEQEVTRNWLVGLGIPLEVAEDHDFGQRIVVEISDYGTLVKSTYFYNCYSCSAQVTGKRTFLKGGCVIAEVENDRHRGYSTRGKGSLDTEDGEDGWHRDEGLKDFDRVAHKILRGQ